MLRLFMAAESASADMAKRTVCTVKDCTFFDPNLNPAGKCQGFSDCNNDAIGVVSRDPYDHVSWSPVVTPRPYCLNCYNERVLYALEFIRREIQQVQEKK